MPTPMTRNILLTGGAGYIGSHVAVALAEAGYRPVILDSFINARRSVIDRIGRIMGQRPALVEADIRDRAVLAQLFEEYDIAAVVHFAALKAVGDSVERPLDYAEVNVGGLIGLMQEMAKAGVLRLVFSSSATVYGEADVVPTPETAPLQATNPYGWTKIACEEVIEQAMAADPRWVTGRLRYFNPVGAHSSGLIGEDPDGVPDNLMPYIARVATGDLDSLQIFGDDYPTPDGTGLRDYIHVEDLAEGHVLSLDRLIGTGESHLVNLGTGRAHSVKEMLAAYSRASERDLPWQLAPRRAGDVPVYLADVSKAEALLGFQARRDLDEMCASSWHWINTGARED